MSKWKKFKLGEVVSLEYGKSLKGYRDGNGDYDVFGTNGKIGRTDKYIYDQPSVIIGRKGAYREVHLARKAFFVIDTAFYTKNIFKELDTIFLFYWLKNININDMDSGSAIPSTSRDEIYDLDFLAPPLPEQKAIATVLSSQDDKIDLLHRQNQTLEALAETLFRQWFVEEAREDWEEKPFNELTDIAIGRTPPRKQFEWFSKNSNDLKWISIKDMGKTGVFIFDTAEYLTKEAVKKFRIPVIPKNTVVLSFKMTVGRVGITTEDMLSNEAIAHFVFKPETAFSKEYLYLFLKTFKYEVLGTTSSIVTSLNSKMIKDMMILVPDRKIMKEFQGITEHYFNKIWQNQSQIQTLAKLRDTLLPKLMSGEVRVQT